MKITIKILLFASGVSMLLSTTSCKKTIEVWKDKVADTVHDTLTTRSDSRVIEYKIENFTDFNIKGAIDEETRQITLYLPHYSRLELLEASITLPQGATISPTAEELVPVFSTSPFKYTVTGKSGLKTEYTVKVIIQQPGIKLNELSTSSATKVINIASAWEILTITGENMVPAFSSTSLYFMDAEGKEVYRVPEYLGFDPLTYNMSFVIDANGKSTLQPATDYWLELRSYALKTKMKFPVRITK